MSLNWWRYTVVVSLCLAVCAEIHYFLTGWQPGEKFTLAAWLAVGVVLVAKEFFGPGLSRSQHETTSLVYLRSVMHPSLRGYCGYESQLWQLRREGEPETVLMTAIRHPSGRVFGVDAPGRHHHVVALMSDHACAGLRNTRDQGFITSKGRYLGREDAWGVAAAAGQIQRITGSPGELYSEDLWQGPLLSKQEIETRAWELVHEAHHSCKVVTIDLQPIYPLTMGQHDMIVHVRDSLPVIRWKMAQERQAQADLASAS